MTKHGLLEDLRRVAAELERPPTRDEYCRGKGQYTEHFIRKHFGSFDAALKAAKLMGETAPRVTSDAGFKVAKLTSEVKNLRDYVKELEEETLTAKRLRELIGSTDSTKLGQASEWTKGAKKPKHGLTGIPVLFLSDIHFDEVVEASQINFTNAYDRAISTARLQFTFKKAVELLKHRMDAPRYDGIILALGGDLLSGTIHEELAETNEARINESLFALTDILISGIQLLAEEFGRVFVPCVVGNHGRFHRKPRMKNKVFDNFEWIIYQNLVRFFAKDDRVSFLVPDGSDAMFEVYGKRICLTHGDQFNGGTGIAGIFSPLMLGMARKQRRQQAVNQPFDLLMMGHWHQLLMMETLIVNGSVKGYDEYAFNSNFPFEKPQQALFIVHPEWGITCRWPVVCDDVGEAPLKKGAPKLSW